MARIHTNAVQSAARRLGRTVLGALATMLFVSALGACGGPQQPPTEGECREWREWVPPEQQADGTWREGYCRDREGGQ